MSDAPLKILHCPTSVGGNPQGLARAERALGLQSETIIIKQNYLNYSAEHETVIFQQGNALPRGLWNLLCALYRSFFCCDVVHYNAGKSFIPMWVSQTKGKLTGPIARFYNRFVGPWFGLLDVKVAKALGRTVVVTYQGDDARQRDYCLAHYPIHFHHEESLDVTRYLDDDLQRKAIATFDKHADYIYALNPDLLHVLPDRASFVPYASVSPEEWDAHWPSVDVPEVPHIVHAPTNRAVKGSDYVLDACARLEKEGVPFRLSLVEGMSNSDARKVYEQADLLIDQLLAGYYGGLAVELMSLGRPVMCYMREEDIALMPEEMQKQMPIINATPDTIYDVLKEWLTTRKGELKARGEASRAYAQAWHDPMKIAARLKEDYLRTHGHRGQ